MKKRILSIMDVASKRTGRVILCVTMLIIAVISVAITKINKSALEVNSNRLESADIELTVQEREEAQSETQPGVLYINERLGFSVEFPAEWENLYVIGENYIEYDERGGAGIAVYQKSSREALPEAGALFFIDRWIGTWAEKNSLIFSGNNTIVLQNGKYTYMLRTPSGVQYKEDDEEIIEEYMMMYDQLDLIISSVKRVDNV